jgi:nicotinate-nucleotide--dimethylbenzimidazole phosphoribosyltransferase
MSLLSETMTGIVPRDAGARAAAVARLERLTMPPWALGRLMDLAADLAGMTGSLRPPVERKAVVVMAGDHGVAAEGVSKFPQEVTLQMVRNFVAGGAGINALARLAGARVVVVDMGVAGDLGGLAEGGEVLSRRIGPGTGNIAAGAAMSRAEAVRSIEAGIEVALELAPGTDIFGTGDMGIANTTPSSAVIAALTGLPPAEVTGRGTGIDDERLRRKVAVIEGALRVNRPDPGDPIDVLAKVGGFEIGGIAGLILGAASLRKPVLVDGFISTAGALIAWRLAPQAGDYMIASHMSRETGHRVAQIGRAHV